MGCCVSTTTNNSKHNSTPQPILLSLEEEEEEESVKEVLLETPAPTKKKPTILETTHQENNIDPLKYKALLPIIPKNPDEKPVKESGFKQPVTIFHQPEVGSEEDASKKNDDHHRSADTRQRSFRQHSLSGDSRRERVVGKSPEKKRSDPGMGRVRSGKEARGAEANNGPRRDFGERSGRRSRSPETRSDGGRAEMGLGGNGLARKTGNSPGRTKSEMAGRIRKVEDPNSREGREDKWPPTSNNESLENPVVSLECFIFL